MDVPVKEILYGAFALLVLLGAVALIGRVCRRPPFTRLRVALSLLMFAGSFALFRAMVPELRVPLRPYSQIAVTFALAYTTLKVIELSALEVLRRRGRVPPPAILRDVVTGVLAAIMLVVLLRSVLGVDITALVATSAAVSIVLGLALQETLSNLFAGLALIIEPPFEPGDWVQFDNRIGQVKEVSWRAVRLQLLKQDDSLVVPNSVIAKTQIVNMSRPPRHGQSVEARVGLADAPNRVCRVLEAAAGEVDGVMPAPPPFAVIDRFDTFAVIYRLTFWIQDFERLNEIRGAVMAHVWYALRRHDMQIPVPVSNIYSRQGIDADAETERRTLERIAGLLHRVDFLGALAPEDIGRLATQTRLQPYPAGVVVVRQGDAGDSLFVVAAGRVQVSQTSADGREHVLATLGPGEYFGEMSLLTGAPRTATVRAREDSELLLLTHEALRPILLNDPTAAERLSGTLIRRRADTLDRPVGAAAEKDGAEADLPHYLVHRIRRFFHLVDQD